MKQSGCFHGDPNRACTCSIFASGNYSGLFAKHREIDQAVVTIEEKKTKQEIDTMLSEAMSALTFEERQKQQEVLHGVDMDIAEEATFIDAALQELDEHLKGI